jgi:shikimate 5-dehydrogenase
VGGIGMLAAQASFSFRLWTGREDGVLEHMLAGLR